MDYVKEIPGIEIDEEGRVISISGSFEKVVRDIIKLFSRFNPLAKNTIVTSLIFAKIQCPERRNQRDKTQGSINRGPRNRTLFLL